MKGGANVVKNHVASLKEFVGLVANFCEVGDKEKIAEVMKMMDKCSNEKPISDELINYLRLNTKYILFDLESRMRENKYLRDLIGDDS